MNDLERELRDLLREDAHEVPAEPAPPPNLRRAARWRQTAFAAVVGGSALAFVGAIVVVASLVSPLEDEAVPADRPTATGTLNGITITYPESWSLIDPDQAGLNGASEDTRDLPRLVLALSPQPASDMLACPGLVEGQPPTFLMTVQERPLALSGHGAAPWPATLERAAIPRGDASGCYPDWAFEQASWTVEGRTFEAVVGTSPAISDDDRNALVAAFGSMTFAPSETPATSVVLATGTAGGEDWELVASRQDGSLSLSLQGESFGTGTGGFDPRPEHLEIASHVFGEGADRELVIFGAVPAGVVRVVGTEVFPGLGEPGISTDVLDVPDEIDPHLDAFAMVIRPDATPVRLDALDAEGNIVLRGTVEADGSEPEVSTTDLLEDGKYFGIIRAVDVEGRTIEFDLAIWLSGEEANQAYQEATGETGPVPNDHFVVNDHPKLRKLALAPDLELRLLDWNRCCETHFDGDLALFAQAIETQSDVTDGDLIYRGQSSWWITVKDGVVTKIEEQYSP